MSAALLRAKLLAHLAAADGRGLLLREMLPRAPLPSEVDAARAELDVWLQAGIVRFSAPTDRWFLLDYRRALASVSTSGERPGVPLRPNVQRQRTTVDQIREIVRRRRVLSMAELCDELPHVDRDVVRAAAGKLVMRGDLARPRAGVLCVPSIAQERRP